MPNKNYFLLFCFSFISVAAIAQTKPNDPCDKVAVTKLPGQFSKPSEINTGSAFSADVANERKIMNYIYSIIAAEYRPAGLKTNNQFNFYNTNKTSWGTKNNNNKYGSDYSYDVYNFRYQCQTWGFYIDGHFDFSLSFAINEGNIFTDSVPVIDYDGSLYRNKEVLYNTLPEYWIKKNGQLTQLENGYYYCFSEDSPTKNYQWLITKDGKLPFKYVTRREFLQKTIRFNQIYLTELKKHNSIITPNIENALKSYAADLQKPESWLNEISTVSSQYNSKDKFYRYNFVNPTEKGALLLMQPNPVYEDKKRPASAPQYMRVYLKIYNDHPEAKKLMAIIQGNIDKLVALVQTGVPGKAINTKDPEFAGVVKDNKTSTPDAGTFENADYTFKPLIKLDKLPSIAYPVGFKSALPAAPQNINKPVAALPAFNAPNRSVLLNTISNTVSANGTFQKQIDDLKKLVAAKLDADNTRKINNYLKQKKISTSVDLNNYAIAAWTAGKPTLALYLFCKALQADYNDMNAANNLASLLTGYGYAEKAIPVLFYINNKINNSPAVLANIATAYYNLGDMNNASAFATKCIDKDSLNANGNKVAAFVHLNKATQTGNKTEAEKAIGCLKKSLQSKFDQEASDMLNKFESNHSTNEDYANSNYKEFPMLKRLQLPAMPEDITQIKSFNKILNKERSAISKTMEDIRVARKKIPELSSQQRTNNMKNNAASILIKAAMITTQGGLQYNKQKNDLEEIYKLNLKSLATEHNKKTNAILKKYSDQINKLEGGEGNADEEEEIERLMKARCSEFNQAQSGYLSIVAQLTNKFAQQSEYVSRSYWRDYANWQPMTAGDNTMAPFLQAQIGYLTDVHKILSVIPVIEPCIYPSQPIKEDKAPIKPKQWEEDYCANFKGAYGLGPAKISFNCNSMSLSGGEGFVGELGLTFNENGSFKEITIGAGIGVEGYIGNQKITAISAGASAMEYINIGAGPNGNIQVNDWGISAGVSAGGNIGTVGGEINIASGSLSANEGVKAGGYISNVLGLNKP